MSTSTLNIVQQAQYTSARIPLSQIVGFVAAVADYDAAVVDAIPAHQSLPNPRQSFAPASLEIIDEIAATGSIQVPPTVVLVENGQYAILDGFTRLTGLTRYVAANNLDPAELSIDVSILSGDYGDDRWRLLRLTQWSLNSERVQLTPADELERIESLRGEYTFEEMMLALGKDPNQNASRGWMRRMLAVTERPSLMKAVQDGEIRVNDAQRMAVTSDDDEDARVALTQFRETEAELLAQEPSDASLSRRKKEKVQRETSAKTTLRKTVKALDFGRVVGLMSNFYVTAITAKIQEAQGHGVAFADWDMSPTAYESMAQDQYEATQALTAIAAVQVAYKQAQSIEDVFANPLPHLRLWAQYITNPVRKNLGLEDREYWAQVGEPLPELKPPGRKAGGKNKPLTDEEKAKKAAEKAEAAAKVREEKAQAKAKAKADADAAKAKVREEKAQAKADADAAKAKAKADADAAKAKAKADADAAKAAKPASSNEPPKPKRKKMEEENA